MIDGDWEELGWDGEIYRPKLYMEAFYVCLQTIQGHTQTTHRLHE